MASYPVEIRRCQHIKTSGAQCGSPALRNEKLCYYHKHNRLAPAELYLDGDRYCDSQIMIPPFEDAHSIQRVLGHIVQLMLQKRIDRKDASLAICALLIASQNLKQVQGGEAAPHASRGGTGEGRRDARTGVDLAVCTHPARN